MWDFITAGGPIMWLLVITSIAALTFAIERGMALRWNRVIPPDLAKAAEDARSSADTDQVRQLCEANPSPLSRILMVAVNHSGRPPEEVIDSVETRARHEVNRLERGLVVLEIVVGIAPLLGLVGTIHGLSTLFGDLARAQMSDNSILAKGIAIALNTTLAGLMIAIPAIIAWSYFNKKIENMAVEMETLTDSFLRHQRREKTPR